MSSISCTYCFRNCWLEEGKTGFCRVRKNIGGKNVSVADGCLTALALDPIEKKPLKHFYPGSKILSAGSFGCNMHCSFCQNHSISMADVSRVDYRRYTAKQLSEIVVSIPENLGVAFTYNEPFLNYEYIIETAKLIKPYDKKVVLVTNGCFSTDILELLKPYVDAMNIDLKGDRLYYRELGGDYDSVMKTIAGAASFCHVEVTTLVVPGKNDTKEFIREQAEKLREIDPEIVYHLSRYFPQYQSTIQATEPDVIHALKKEAEEILPFVYTGNLW